MSAPPPVAASALPAPPRWGVRTGLFQPRRPAFWLFVVLLIVGGLYALLVQLLALLSAAPGFALGWFLLLFYIVPVLLVVRWLDLYEREPASLMVGAFAGGVGCGDVMGVGSGRSAQDLGYRGGTPPRGMLFGLEDQHGCAFAHDESVTVDIERPGVSGRRQGACGGEPLTGSLACGGLGAAVTGRPRELAAALPAVLSC